MYGSGSSSLFDACRVLFGPEVNLSEEFLDYLQPGGVKTAFRQKAKETHPDAAFRSVICSGMDNTNRFRKVAEAYRLLCGYLDERERGFARGRSVYATVSDTDNSVDRQKTADQLYYKGNLPSRPLQLGRYLYYRGFISFQMLINALAWQRRSRRSIGQLACEAGWLASIDIAAVLADKRGGKFGEKAVRMGLITSIQLSTLLLRQSMIRHRIGDYFVANSGLSRKFIERSAVEMQRHNMQFKTGC